MSERVAQVRGVLAERVVISTPAVPPRSGVGNLLGLSATARL
jgi:hypothetical protein